MAHCVALGLDPAIAVSRRPGAHTQERTSERIVEPRIRQNFVLEEVRRQGLVIETCPTANR